MSSRRSRSRKSNTPGYNNRRTASMPRGSGSMPRGSGSSARVTLSRSDFSDLNANKPNNVTIGDYTKQLIPIMEEKDKEEFMLQKVKRNRAKPYFEIYKIIKSILPTLETGIINDILNEYITRESKKTPYYTRLQRIVDTHHDDLNTFMHDKILLSDMEELCDSVPPSWKFIQIPFAERPEIEKVKNLQGKIESLCRRKLGKRVVGGIKSRKRQKKQKKKTKRRYNR